MNTQEKEIILVFKHLLNLLGVSVSNRDLSDYWQSIPITCLWLFLQMPVKDIRWITLHWN